ncbi:STAS domain-containing protein [Caenimonas koreensis]|uniref:STAS domain-containing protein n=1 Tax=Caenimonas koreensis DSM 17982 TaxID=1121255 RepID=A0A844B9F8_9BURK|nr:STAS domain-containing protein [Caenimonas koreensis]MRD47161.1 STAS domain-containing protein [Caenimonas koreensis DSM 17982]
MIILPSQITHEEAAACCRMLAQGLRSQTEAAVVADAGGLERFDSSALAVLLEIRREAAALGKTLSISRMPARLRELATLYGVAQLLPAAP